jgi:hypothetical protein
MGFFLVVILGVVTVQFPGKNMDKISNSLLFPKNLFPYL